MAVALLARLCVDAARYQDTDSSASFLSMGVPVTVRLGPYIYCQFLAPSHCPSSLRNFCLTDHKEVNLDNDSTFIVGLNYRSQLAPPTTNGANQSRQRAPDCVSLDSALP